jgi:hypothetical protein
MKYVEIHFKEGARVHPVILHTGDNGDGWNDRRYKFNHRDHKLIDF